MEILKFPPEVDFPVTLVRDISGYRILESWEDFTEGYSLETVFVSPTGNDSTGDGSRGNPYKTIDKAHSVVSDGSTVYLEPGIYAPFTLTKNLLIECLGGEAFIGTFEDLKDAQIDASGVLWNVDDVNSGQTFRGFLRTDGVRNGGVIGSTQTGNVSQSYGSNNLAISYQEKSILSVYAGGTSANFSPGPFNIPKLVKQGAILAFSDADLGSTTLGGTSRLKNIVFASFAVDVVVVSADSNLVFSNCGFYGGTDSCITIDAVDTTSIMLDCHGAGSRHDLVDYRENVVAVESNCHFKWPGFEEADNTSTAHESVHILRVGGEYAGGSRTIHDINDAISLNFSLLVHDALFVDQTLMRIGRSAGPDASRMLYGDISFKGERVSDFIADTGATAEKIDLSDAWPYGSSFTPKDFSSRGSRPLTSSEDPSLREVREVIPQAGTIHQNEDQDHLISQHSEDLETPETLRKGRYRGKDFYLRASKEEG